MDPSNVTIILPALNEEAAIGTILASLRSSLPESEIIVIDDGSIDHTAQVAREHDVTVISHSYQRGYGAALKTGIRASTKECILCCDADGQHRIDDALSIIEHFENHDLIVGARTSESHAPLLRRPGKFILSKFANTLSGARIPDLNSGLRMFKKETLLRYLHLMPDGFSFSTTSTFAMLKSHRDVDYVPITVDKRVGRSTVNQFRHGPEVLLLIIRLIVLFEPLKVFLSCAGLLFAISIISLIIDIFGAGGLLAGGKGIADTTVILSIATLFVFLTGLLCDQVSALRREKHE